LATSPTLPPLSQAPNPGLVGYVAAYYLPQEDLLQEPELVAGAIALDLVLAPGAGWRKLPFTANTLKLDEQPKTTRDGTQYQVRVTAQRPQPSAGVLDVVTQLDRRKLLLLLVEAGGGRRLLGSTEEYVQLLTSGEGQNPASRAGLELRLEGTTTRLAPYYLGGAPLLSGGAVAAPVGRGGYVSIEDKHGNLMLRVPAGKTVVVASSFSVKLEIK
jgi:hypothetical protein